MSFYSTTSTFSLDKQYPPIPQYNRTLHIANLPWGKEAVKPKLQNLLAEHTGFQRVKVNDNKNKTACFGIAYFVDIKSATDAMRKLQNHKFTGPSGEGLLIDYMTSPKASYPDVKEIQQQAERSNGASNIDTKALWGNSLTTLIAPVYASHSAPHSLPSEHAAGEIKTSIGDKPFNPNYGGRTSNRGLMGSRYANPKDSDSQSVSFQEEIPVNIELNPVPAPEISKEIDLNKVKDIALGFKTKEENCLEDGKNFVPELQEEQKNSLKKDPREELLKKFSHLNQMLLAMRVLQAKKTTVEQRSIVEKVPLLENDGNAAVMEAEMISAPQKLTADKTPDPESSSELTIAKPEVPISPGLELGDWEDEF